MGYEEPPEGASEEDHSDRDETTERMSMSNVGKEGWSRAVKKMSRQREEGK
jgi:hypothetical protein